MLSRIFPGKLKRPERRMAGPALIALGMFALICAQLIWWLIFFTQNQTRRAELEQELDRVRLATVRGERDAVSSDLFTEGPDGGLQIAPELQAARAEEQRRELFMMVSETVFVILVFGYGTFRVIRAIQRERRLSRERSVFMESVTHELKTPLTSALLNLQTILKRKPPPEQQQELIEDSIDDVRRLEEQLNNILLSGRLAREGVRGEDPPPGGLAAAAEIAIVLENEKRVLQQHRLELSADVPEDLRLRLGAESFRQIIHNLTFNSALYASGEGRTPRLSISAHASPERPRFPRRGRREAVFHFRDNGPGIPDAELDNVFKPFYRLRGARRVKGSGMGLYIVRELIRGAGGDIRALPCNDGAWLEARLPLHSAGGAAAP